MFEKIVGHRNVCEFLTRSQALGRLVHAYLFVGPRHIGKMTLARAFAEALLHGGGAVPHTLETHPDAIIVNRAIDEKTGAPKSVISIEQIRALRERLAQTSLLPGWKIAIIDEAEYLQLPAANALLKTLEEPRGQTLIILIASDLRRIPLTIRSRAQLIRFGLVSRKELERDLAARGKGPREAALIARVSRGRPGVALRYIEKQDLLADFLESVRERSALLEEQVSGRILWIEKNIKGKKDVQLSEELLLWRGLLRDKMLSSVGAPELTTFGQLFEKNQTSPPKADAPREHALGGKPQTLQLRRLIASEAALRHHIDPRLAFEYFLCI